ncbi:MAG: uracil-DNA glycosylase family protein, partial [Parvularculaceae bacterium]
SRGTYDARPDDGLTLAGAMITNAVRCVPPANKPETSEIKTCRQFLVAQIAAMRNLAAILCLGRISHDSTLAALGMKPREAVFAHCAEHKLASGVSLFDSYHCSRYNTNTGRLTPDMFRAVFADIRKRIG